MYLPPSPCSQPQSVIGQWLAEALPPPVALPHSSFLVSGNIIYPTVKLTGRNVLPIISVDHITSLRFYAHPNSTADSLLLTTVKYLN